MEKHDNSSERHSLIFASMKRKAIHKKIEVKNDDFMAAVKSSLSKRDESNKELLEK